MQTLKPGRCVNSSNALNEGCPDNVGPEGIILIDTTFSLRSDFLNALNRGSSWTH